MPRLLPPLLLGITVVLTACVTALVAHVLIDMLGDFALVHDAYDRIEHGSRLVIFAGSVGLVTLALFWLWCSAVADARTPRSGVRDLLISAGRCTATPVAIIATIGLAVVMIGGMECVDVFRGGEAATDLADAFGGSLLLGLSVSVALGTLFSVLGARILQYVARTYDCLVVAVRSTFRATSDRSQPVAADRVRSRIPRVSSLVVVRRAAKRGPPLTPRFG